MFLYSLHLLLYAMCVELNVLLLDLLCITISYEENFMKIS